MPSFVGYPSESPTLRTKRGAELVTYAKERLAHARTYRQQEREEVWRMVEDQYIGNHWQHMVSDDVTADHIVVNMSFSTINVIVPYITGSEPQFLVTPFSGDATMVHGKMVEAWLNRLWRSNKFGGQEATEAAAWDALLYGDGYLKTGYDIVSRRQSADADYATIAELWLARVDPWDVWIDPRAFYAADARYLIQRIRVPKAEIEAEGSKYKNTKNLVYGNVPTEDDERKRDDEHLAETNDGIEVATIYEFYDLVNNHRITFSMDEEYPLEWTEDIGGCPIFQFGSYRIPGSPYHMGELEQLWDLQQELNKTRSDMLTHRRRNTTKYLARKDLLDAKAQEVLASGQQGAVAFVSDAASDMPLEDIIQPINLPPLQYDMYQGYEAALRDIYEISGVNEYLRGSPPEIRRTATEASIIEGASNAKTQAKLRMIEKALRRVGNALVAIARDVFPITDFEELTMYLTGREAEIVNRAAGGEALNQMFDAGMPDQDIASAYEQMNFKSAALIQPTAEWFTGEYEVDVVQASTELRNPLLKEQKYREMAITVANMMPLLMQAGVPINLHRVMELWFEAAGIDDVAAMFEPGTTMLAQPMAAMEQMMMQGGPGVPTPGAPRAVDAATAPAPSSANTGAFETQAEGYNGKSQSADSESEKRNR